MSAAHRGRDAPEEGGPAAGRRTVQLIARVLLVALALLAAPRPGAAQTTLVEGDDLQLELAGYARSLTGLHGLDIEGDGRPGGRTGLSAATARLKWTLRIGDAAVLEVHDRLLSRTLSDGGSVAGPAPGLAVSAVPGRAVDLESVLVDEDGIRVWHDVDRLALTVYTENADITVGRQAVTWGLSSLFPVADLFARFSPFELDTREKPGSDAVRVLMYPASGLELDAVAADRGAAGDWSGGVRATLALDRGDLYGMAGKFWDEAMIGGGATLLLDAAKLRAEAVFPAAAGPWDALRPRATLGVDYIASDLQATLEYHYNGAGAAGPAGYLDQLGAPVFRRGESYYLGRHYMGAVVGRTGAAGLSANVSAIANLADGSLMLAPTLAYDIGQNSDVSVGAFHGLGEAPVLESPPVPSLRSEYGTYGSLYFLQLSVYF